MASKARITKWAKLIHDFQVPKSHRTFLDFIPKSYPTHGPKAILAAHTGGHIHALAEPLPEHITDPTHQIRWLTWDDPESHTVLWHSGAHVLGAAMEAVWGDTVLLEDGPAIASAKPGGPSGGFFYDGYFIDGRVITDDDYTAVTQAARQLINAKAPFERLQVPREVAQDLFQANPLKLAALARIPDSAVISLWRCGDFVDLCAGPHVPHTGLMSAWACVKHSGSEWQGVLPAPIQRAQDTIPAGQAHLPLQRMYGVAFPDKALLKQWQAAVKDAAARDHRVIGKRQKLFFFHPTAPGSAFWLPAGTAVLNKLYAMLRAEYLERGYQELVTPLVFGKQLWETSGHWEAYAEDMFGVEPARPGPAAAPEGSPGCPPAGTTSGLKPMNCPGHCLVFGSETRSFRDLPLRFADFSPLHRNEATGALSGLTRLRRFTQDDGHVFCTPEQVQAEVAACLDMLHTIYSRFGFRYSLRLSTRPDKYIGDVEAWADAEEALRIALEQATSSGEPDAPTGYGVDEGGGAFYGPKIDVVLYDALDRAHQCGTIQLDFQLPQRFQLEYTGSDGHVHRPVIIHRAILGSLERMMAVLMENSGGRWPLWLSPAPVVVTPLHVEDAQQAAAAQACAAELTMPGLHPSMDTRDGRSLPKRVREAFSAGTCVVAVLGESEAASGNVTLRFRDEGLVQGWNQVAKHADLPVISEGAQITLQPSQARQGLKAMLEAWM